MIIKVISIAFNTVVTPFRLAFFFHSFVSIVINCRFDKYPKFLTYFKVFDLIALSLLFVRISKVLVS